MRCNHSEAFCAAHPNFWVCKTPGCPNGPELNIHPYTPVKNHTNLYLTYVHEEDRNSVIQDLLDNGLDRARWAFMTSLEGLSFQAKYVVHLSPIFEIGTRTLSSDRVMLTCNEHLLRWYAFSVSALDRVGRLDQWVESTYCPRGKVFLR